jgi:thymidylate kinase
MWTDLQAETLKSVFDALNEAEIDWLIIRNYVGLPEANTAKDIDLIVPKAQINYAISKIFDVLRNHGFSYYEHQRFECIWCFTFYSLNEREPQSIKIDLLYGFVWRGAVVVSAEEMLSANHHYNEIPVPDETMDGFLLWVKPLMTGGFIKEKYRADIQKSITNNPEGFYHLLESKFGNQLATSVWPSLESGNLDETIAFKNKLCRTAWLLSLRASPIRTFISTVEHFGREIYRRSNRPPASFFAVVGPDGVGKTTFINLLKQELCRVLVRDDDGVVITHFRPNVFPNIKKLFSGKNYDDSQEVFNSPHRAAPAGTLGSLIRITYYWLDYVLGYWLKIRKHCIAGKIYVFDRYFYDFVVDPYRSRIRLPLWLRKAYLATVPKPDLVFFLDCDADIVFARKQELSRDEIERQMKECRKLVASSPQRFVTLNAEQPPDESCRKALKELIATSFYPL